MQYWYSVDINGRRGKAIVIAPIRVSLMLVLKHTFITVIIIVTITAVPK